MHRHVCSMADGTYSLGQVVEVMKPRIVAGEGGHIFWPRCKDKQRTIGTSLEAATLRFPISANRGDLQMDQSELLFQSDIFDTFLTFRDTRSDQHISAVGC